MSKKAAVPLAARLTNWLVASSLIFFTVWVFDTVNLPKQWLFSLAILLGALSIPRPAAGGASVVWAGFWAAFLASTFAGIDPIVSLVGHYVCGWENGVMMLLCTVAYFVGTGVGAAGGRKSFEQSVFIAGLITCTYLLIQKAGLDPFVWSRGDTLRPIGFMGNNVYQGSLVALVLPWAPDVFGALAIFSGVASTSSRAALLAASAVGSVKLWSRPGGRWVVAGLAALCVGAVVYFHRAHSDSVHWTQNVIAVQAFKQRPLLGWGPATTAAWFIRLRTPAINEAMGGRTVLMQHTHTHVTNILATQGLIGLLAWGVTLLFGFRAAGAKTRLAMLSVGVFGLFNPIPHMAYGILAYAVGIDAGEGSSLVPVGKWGLVRALGCVVPVSAFLLAGFFSLSMLADHMARVNRWDKAAVLMPWEFAYAEHVSDLALRSLVLHRQNPLVYPGAVQALRHTGREEEAERVKLMAWELDPLHLTQ